MVKNKDKPWWKRLLAKVTALAAAICMMLLPATAHADMQGVDMSNWQCGVDVYNMQADFVIVGTTWGTGQVNNNCLVSGVNTDANRMIAQAQASGKKFGLYHYAMGGNPEAEAQFFWRNTSKMCIRDRCKHDGAGERAHPVHANAECGQSGHAGMAFDSCLLYTSP